MKMFETTSYDIRAAGPAEAAADSPDGAWMLLSELNHRVANGYTAAISALSLAARRVDPIAGAHLAAARRRLQAYAEAHRAHLAPLGARTDLCEHLARLCLSIVRADLAERGVALTFIGEPCDMASDVCWRVGLIVSELITNAVRHGVSAGGEITVELRRSGADVHCVVRNSGSAGQVAAAGHGTRIVSQLARELGGRIVRNFDASGCCVVLALQAPLPA